jgi:hypothetical protein
MVSLYDLKLIIVKNKKMIMKRAIFDLIKKAKLCLVVGVGVQKGKR